MKLERVFHPPFCTRLCLDIILWVSCSIQPTVASAMEWSTDPAAMRTALQPPTQNGQTHIPYMYTRTSQCVNSPCVPLFACTHANLQHYCFYNSAHSSRMVTAQCTHVAVHTCRGPGASTGGTWHKTNHVVFSAGFDVNAVKPHAKARNGDEFVGGTVG